MTLTLTQLKARNTLPVFELSRKTAGHALKIEAVPPRQLIGSDQRFWVIHVETDLKIPGQFSRVEAETILKVTELWDWTVDPQTREPACCVQLLRLLEEVCSETQLKGGES